MLHQTNMNLLSEIKKRQYREFGITTSKLGSSYLFLE